VQGDSGELLLELVEGGEHFTCRIDVATGKARLTIGQGQFDSADGTGASVVEADTVVRGPGKYTLRFSNCDDELLLWVNESIVKFSGPTTYPNRTTCNPRWSLQDPGDLAPAGLGTNGAAVSFSNMRILRDVYYIAGSEYHASTEASNHTTVFRSPEKWSLTDLFSSRGSISFPHIENQEFLGPDQFFPLGDNSPQSEDARSWSSHYPEAEEYVDRKFLIGKALVIYWPHAWNRPVPFTPNVQRMGIIR
jgi:signal peptidase I